MFFQPVDTACPHLLGEAVDDLDAGEIALVHGTVKRLACKRLLVDGAVGVAVKKTAQFVFEFVYAFHRAGNQLPCKVLVGQPFTPFNGVHEMALDRITFSQRDVVAALHHARAAAFAKQPFHGNGNGQVGVVLMGMQRGEQAGAAGAEDQDVGLDGFHK